MKESFDNFLEKDKDKKEKSEKKKTGLKLPLFELTRAEQDETEKNKSFFDLLKPDETVEEEPEPESPEHLDDEETQHIVAEYIDSRVEDIAEKRKETPEADPEAIASLDANAALLENLREANQEGKIDSDEDLDEVLATTVEELEVSAVPEIIAEEEDEEPVIPPPPARSVPPMPPMGVPPSPDLSPIPPPAEKVTYVENRKKQAANLLVGGAVGYLIGRRRGRIKTERRLIPIQEKLEKEVKDLHGKIAEREEKIRTIAAEKIRTTPETERKNIVEKLETAPEPEIVKTPEVVESSKLEKLVKAIIPPVERAPQKPESKEIKRAEELALPELLAVAKRMEFQGITVDQLYERGQIDSLGLRRAVSEYLAGRRFETALIENLRRYDSPEHLQTNITHSSSGGAVGAGGTYGATTNRPQENQTQATATSSAYGASGFGTAPNPQAQKPLLPPAYIVGAAILGLIITAFLIL